MDPIKVGIIGGAGYTGGELLRILIYHPNVEVVFVNSTSQNGKKVWETHKDLFGSTDLVFTNEQNFKLADVLFLCSGHGFSVKFFKENAVSSKIKIVDLSADFRDESDDFVYGLPELQRESQIKLRIQAALLLVLNWHFCHLLKQG